jgi:hypothetical protein
MGVQGGRRRLFGTVVLLLAKMGLLIRVMLPPPLSVNRVNALDRGGSGVYGANGTAYGGFSFGHCRWTGAAGLRNDGGSMGDNGHGWRGWGPGFFMPFCGRVFTLGQCGIKKGGVNELGKAGRLLSVLLSGSLGPGRFGLVLGG